VIRVTEKKANSFGEVSSKVGACFRASPTPERRRVSGADKPLLFDGGDLRTWTQHEPHEHDKDYDGKHSGNRDKRALPGGTGFTGEFCSH
jgi:hypothetical protein